MRRDLRRMFLPALGFAAAGAGLAACSGGSEDDPAESEPACQILWASLAGAADTYDVYLVEMPESQWVPSGSRTFAPDAGIYGMFYDDFNEVSAPTWTQRLVATGGTFLIATTQAAPSAGGGLSFDDGDAQAYFDLDDDENIGTVPIGSGGNGSFDGVWSPEDASPPEPGAGTIAIAVGTSALTLGTYVSYAQCFDPSASAATSAAIRSRSRPLPRPLPLPRLP